MSPEYGRQATKICAGRAAAPMPILRVMLA
jgi:hypothetical protein